MYHPVDHKSNWLRQLAWLINEWPLRLAPNITLSILRLGQVSVPLKTLKSIQVTIIIIRTLWRTLEINYLVVRKQNLHVSECTVSNHLIEICYLINVTSKLNMSYLSEAGTYQIFILCIENSSHLENKLLTRSFYYIPRGRPRSEQSISNPAAAEGIRLLNLAGMASLGN